MIGNNSCGATAQRSGKVVDNIARLEVLTYGGARFWCGETDEEELAAILADNSDPRCAAIYRQLVDSSATSTRTRSGVATPTSRAGYPGTTSTRSFPSTASMSPGSWSGASQRS